METERKNRKLKEVLVESFDRSSDGYTKQEVKTYKNLLTGLLMETEDRKLKEVVMESFDSSSD